MIKKIVRLNEEGRLNLHLLDRCDFDVCEDMRSYSRAVGIQGVALAVALACFLIAGLLKDEETAGSIASALFGTISGLCVLIFAFKRSGFSNLRTFSENYLLLDSKISTSEMKLEDMEVSEIENAVRDMEISCEREIRGHQAVCRRSVKEGFSVSSFVVFSEAREEIQRGIRARAKLETARRYFQLEAKDICVIPEEGTNIIAMPA